MNREAPEEQVMKARIIELEAELKQLRRLNAILMRNSARYRQLTEAAGAGIWVIDTANNTTLVNESMAAMLGCSREEVVGQPMCAFVDDAWRAVLDAILEQCSRSVKSRHELLLRRKDGSGLWTIVSAVPIFDEPGRYGGALWMLVEISEMKRTEEALRESEAEFRVLAEMAGVGIVLAQGGRMLYANPAVEAISGYSQDELLSMDLWDVLHPDYRETIRKRALARQPGENLTDRYEAKIITRAGEERWCELTTGIVQYKVLPATICTVHDITDRKRVQEQLETQALQQAVIARLGRAALAGDRTPLLMDEAVSYAAQTLDVEFCGVFRRLPSGSRQVLVAGVGWKEGTVGRELEDANETDATMRVDSVHSASGDSVRLSTGSTSLLREHGVASGLSVPIEAQGESYGILGVYTSLQRTFTGDDVNFLSAVANVLTTAMERQRTESALIESEARFRRLAENAPDIIFRYELRPRGHLSYLSPGAVRLLGYTQEEIYSDPDLILRRFGPEKTPKLETLLERTPNTPPIGFQHKDGHEVLLEVHAVEVRDSADNVVALEGIGRDVTGREQAAEALRWESGANEAMANLSGALISAATVDDISLLVLELAKGLTGSASGQVGHSDPRSGWLITSAANRSAQQLSQLEEQDNIFKQISRYWEQVQGDREPLLSNDLTAADPSHESPQGEVVVRRFLCVPAIIGGALVGQVAVAGADRDYDERDVRLLERLAALYGVAVQQKRLEEQLLRAQRLETAGRVAGQVAHDFNNLLGPLALYPDLIRLQLPEGHSTITYCDSMLESVRQMAEINSDMLALSRRGLLHEQPTDLNQLVRQTLADLMDRPASLVIETELASDLNPVKGSPAQLQRVLSNLLANAREAMQDEGSLIIRTANVYVDRPLRRYNQVEVGEYVKLEVIDTGCGIPAQIQDRVFDAFFTSKRTDRRRGSGLGLSVVDAVVSDHGGYIDLESEVGKGSNFTVYLRPLRTPNQAPRVEGLSSGSETVLVVDDDRAQWEVMAHSLRMLGYQVETAASGEEAIASLKQRPVDLLLLDMIMPGGIDGMETFSVASEIRPGQQAIITSGFAETERVQGAQAMGAGAYVRKPVALATLAQAVREELDRRC